jgi:hypothetical protein
MIERTKARLEEARVLLGRLQAEKSRQVQQATPTASPAFFSLLDNCVTTARTVTWVLGSEEKEKYEAWKALPGAAINLADKEEIFKLVNEMRISIEKRGQRGIEARREQVEIPENPHPVARNIPACRTGVDP